MPITVEFVDEPQRGQPVLFQEETVRIGRDPNSCQVVFDKENVLVGREHCELVRYSGQYRLRMIGNHYVAINGVCCEDDCVLPERALLQFGQGGPRISISYIDTSQYPRTVGQGDTSGPRAVAVRASRRASRVFAFSMATFLVMLCWAFYFWRENNTFDATVGMIANEAIEQDKAMKQMKQDHESVTKELPSRWQEVLAKVAPSVCVVCTRSQEGFLSPRATAWVVDSQRRVLATNAHVVELFDSLKSGEELIIQPTGSNKQIRITNVTVHDGYDAFDKAWNEFEPILQSESDDYRHVESAGPAFDVGLMYAESTAELPPALTIGNTISLGKLQPGSPIAYVGFPLEGLLLDGVNLVNPTPKSQIGTISSMTDYFGMAESSFEDRLLVQHTLPTAGGASGSPIVNTDGHVVAIHNAANVIGLVGAVRIDASAGIFYAQRVDLIDELLHGVSERVLDERRRRWDESLQKSYLPLRLHEQKKMKSQLNASWLETLRYAESFEPSVSAELVHNVTTDNPVDENISSGEFTMEIGPLAFGQLLAFGNKRSVEIKLQVLDPTTNEIIGQSSGPDYGWNDQVEFVAPSSGDVKVVVLSNNANQVVEVTSRSVARPERSLDELTKLHVDKWLMMQSDNFERATVCVDRTVEVNFEKPLEITLENLNIGQYLVVAATEEKLDIRLSVYEIDETGKEQFLDSEFRIAPDATVTFQQADARVCIRLESNQKANCHVQVFGCEK